MKKLTQVVVSKSAGITAGIMARAELAGLLELKEAVDARVEELHSLLGRSAARPAQSGLAPLSTGAPKKRTMSAEARSRIAAAQRRRWAEHAHRQAKLNREAEEARRKSARAPQAATGLRKRKPVAAAPAAAPAAKSQGGPNVDFSDLTAAN